MLKRTAESSAVLFMLSHGENSHKLIASDFGKVTNSYIIHIAYIIQNHCTILTNDEGLDILKLSVAIHPWNREEMTICLRFLKRIVLRCRRSSA